MVNKSLLVLVLSILVVMPFVFAAPGSDLTNYEINSIDDVPEGYHLEEDPLCASNFLEIPGMKNILGYGLVLFFVELVLKGFALWKAAKRNSVRWFIALLLFGIAGILPLIYLVISRDKEENSSKK